MNIFFPIIIVAACAAAPTEGTLVGSERVFHCDFESSTDLDFDGWPDGWSRRQGRGFPGYLKARIVEESTDRRPHGKRSMSIELDGGAAIIHSPPIEVSPKYSYHLEGYLKTKKLKHDVAYTTITFYDAKGNPLETHHSDRIRNAQRWTKIQIGPVSPSQANIRVAVIALHLRPTKKKDLVGSAMFDDITLTRMPRIRVRSEREDAIYEKEMQVAIICDASGISELNPLVHFELFDVEGQLLASHEQRLQGKAEKPQKLEAKKGWQIIPMDAKEIIDGQSRWNPPIDDYGFYRIRTTIQFQDGSMLRSSTNVVVIEKASSPLGREFGWSMANGSGSLSLTSLADLLGQVGVSWVKYPIWIRKGEDRWLEEVSQFSDQLNTHSIRLVGVLDRKQVNQNLLEANDTPQAIASSFVDRDYWNAVVVPVMNKLSLKINWWQLGGDDDTSLIYFPDLENKLNEFKSSLEKKGQQTHLGLAWWILAPPPQAALPPWEFLSYSVQPPNRNSEQPELTPAEIAVRRFESKRSRVKNWVAIKPLPKGKYENKVRAKDLALRMLEAKRNKYENIFLTDPMRNHQGLLSEDGAPGYLLLPWRTTALMTSGSDYLGELQMPSGSRNMIFTRGDEAVMVLWSDRPVVETIYLGENLQQTDLWGRVTRVRSEEQNGVVRQRIEVGPLPTFLSGIDLTIARWRMGFQFESQVLPSLFGAQHTIDYRMTGVSSRAANISMAVQVPENVRISLAQKHFTLVPHNLHKGSMAVQLSDLVDLGPLPIRIDVSISADEEYKFSIYRTIQVGGGGLKMEVHTRLDEQGNLIVEQHLLNGSEGFYSFDCLLFSPNRSRLRRPSLTLDPGRNVVTFKLPRGEELIGKTLRVRAEEIRGDRYLNLHFIAER